MKNILFTVFILVNMSCSTNSNQTSSLEQTEQENITKCKEVILKFNNALKSNNLTLAKRYMTIEEAKNFELSPISPDEFTIINSIDEIEGGENNYGSYAFSLCCRTDGVRYEIALKQEDKIWLVDYFVVTRNE